MRHLAASVVFAVCAPLVAQTTWIVDDNGGPGVHFTSLPAAVAAATSGDTLLVAPGHYEPFHVSGKALTIRGDGPATTLVDGVPPIASADYVRIENPPAGQVFRLSGLRLRYDLGSFTVSPYARLCLIGNGVGTSGSVVVHDVVAEGAGLVPWTGGIGLRVDGLVAHVARSEFRGLEWMQGDTGLGFSGAWVRAGGVLVADACTFRGGDVVLYPLSNVHGGIGLLVDASQVWLMRCECRGGSAPPSSTSSSGGIGLYATGSAVVRVYGSSQNLLVGGAAGPSASWLTGAGLFVYPPAVVELFGPVTTATTTSAGLLSPSIAGTGTAVVGQPIRPQLSLTGSAPSGASLAAAQPVTARIDQGLPGELFVLLLDGAPGLSLLPPITSEPLLLANPIVATYGLLDAAGSWAVTFVPAVHTPLLVGVPLHLQAFELDSSAGSWRGSNAVIQRFAP